LIKFDSAENIDATTLTITFENLKNPESLYPVGDIIIMTMMQYSGDSQFYRIDKYTGDSGFIATAGTIVPSTISTVSQTGDLSTYADNQAYLVTFTATHTVYKGGYIKIILPDAFSMSSSSSAVA